MKAGREARYQSRESVAAATGVSVRWLWNVEHGRMTNPRIDEIMVVCSYLGLEADTVFIHPKRGERWLTKSRYARLR